MTEFIHLHTHSHFSLLNALPKIPELVLAAKKNKMPALALTDNGNLYGAISFYKECKKENIKPIIGVDFYIAFRTRHDKQSGIDNKRYRLVLLAKNEIGYKNLIKLVSESNLDGFYYRPRIDKELMKKYSKGLVAILPSFNAETTEKIRGGDFESAKKIFKEYEEIYSSEDLYLEITHHPEISGHNNLTKKIILFSKEIGANLVAAHDVYYINPEDKEARDTLLSVQTNLDFGSNKRLTDEDENFSFINFEKAQKYFEEIPEAIENTIKIAEKCNLEIKLGSWVFPEIKTSNGNHSDEQLYELIKLGLKEKKLKKTKEVSDRIEYEYGIIKEKGYSPYFLVVSDLLRFAHKNNIFTNTRGSAAGSLVSYLIGITNINPLEYQIPFERFLNPDRPSPPDIDVDMADNRRDEMIQYAREKYGEDRVAQIGTFGTMMARGAVRDTARALGYEYQIGDKISKQIPLGKQGFPMTIDKAVDENSDLKKMYATDKDVKKIIDMAKKIEGCARHISVHAAGVVISPTSLTEYTPVQFDPRGGKLITQYDMYVIEDVGLLKFDFLGLKNLSILADSVKLAEKIRNKKVDINNIPLDDKKTYEMLARGETMGVFQLGSDGITKYLKDLRPTEIRDINAMIALYRPGPMAFISEYIKRKRNPKLVKYLDERLREILEPTYGILIYQDDILLIVTKLAGYTWGEVDKFRKAIGKKIPEEMRAQKEKFINGCIKNEMKKDTAGELWKMIETFASYGFNKAHSASYGKVSYQTAYMKANFPVVYMCSLLTADAGDVEKISEIIEECKRMKIGVLPPNINESFGNFTVINDDGKDKIRFGLYSIKNFGQGIADKIIITRKEDGKFNSLEDFLNRVKDKNINKKSLESLIKCGAMDEFGERGQMIENIEDLLSYHREGSKTHDDQISLFGLMKDSSSIPKLKLRDFESATLSEKLSWEKELLGLYISGHPLDNFRDKLLKREYTVKRALDGLEEGMTVAVAGIINETKIINTKSFEKMAFVNFSDLTGTIEVVVFPKIFEKYKNLLEPNLCVIIKGRISYRNQTISLLAETVKEME
ncbi:DNA polymerase III subunit alpha [Patescibacteria group bacterium]|nr:DNA polymerase III subunit alpha [Patescibacteria group bacterium]MBU4115919.1 DNA polymerase III subunit alpha [Patescibacteria group bacterium]